MTASALERLQAAFSPDNLRSAGHRLIDLLATHLDRVQRCEGRVLNWAEPAGNVQRAADWLHSSGAEPLVERFERIVREMLDRGHNLHDPRYIGHQVPAPVPLAGLFDAVGAVTNQVMAVYEMGPWATAVERALVQELGGIIGWPAGQFAGLITHGGSLANLTGLLTARNVSLNGVWERGLTRADRQPVLIAQADAHYSLARAAGILGLGTEQVLKAPLNERRQMDPQSLEDLLAQLRREQRPVVAVAACSCATPIGAFDPLEDIASVCRRYGVWLHVDAAHGGAACLSRKYRRLMRGVEQADSLVWDAHKMMFVPALCAFVFYRNGTHRFEAFRQNAPYLFDPSAPGLADYDTGLLTPECTKRAAAYGLWGVWSLFGRELFEDMLDRTFDLGQTLYGKLTEAADFETLHEPECNIVAFRYVPESLRDAPAEVVDQFLLDLRRMLIQSGEFYIVQTKLEGRQALRVTVMNPLTTSGHLDDLLDAIRATGRRILQCGRN